METPFFENIPEEILIQVFFSLDISDLLNLCKTNINFARLCNDELFWQQRTFRDFGINVKPQNFSWQQLYFYILGNNIRDVSVYLGGQLIGTIAISKNDTFRKIQRAALNLVRKIDPNIVNIRFLIKGFGLGLEVPRNYIINSDEHDLTEIISAPKEVKAELKDPGIYIIGVDSSEKYDDIIDIWTGDFYIEINRVLKLKEGWIGESQYTNTYSEYDEPYVIVNRKIIPLTSSQITKT